MDIIYSVSRINQPITYVRILYINVIPPLPYETDRKTRDNGYSHKELRKFKIARILREAFEQKGVLSQADVAEMLGVSIGTVSRDIREYQIENQVVVPYRTIHDLGRAITQKKITLGHYLKNVLT